MSQVLLTWFPKYPDLQEYTHCLEFLSPYDIGFAGHIYTHFHVELSLKVPKLQFLTQDTVLLSANQYYGHCGTQK